MTGHRITTFAVILILQLVLAACGGDSPLTRPSPTSPSSQLPLPSGPVISGEVYDTALRSIAGARVEIIGGTRAGLWTLTGPDGRYVETGPFASPTIVRASKEGYVDKMLTWSCSGSSCNQNPGPILSFMLTGLEPPVDLAGDYTVTISADPACVDLPATARSRTYEGTINPSSRGRVALTGAAFHRNLYNSFNGFDAAVAGDFVRLFLDGAPWPAVVEETSVNTYLSFAGSASTTVAPGASISATLNGWIEFCTLKSPMLEGYSCEEHERAEPTPSQPVTYARCESSNHHIVLARRP
jgi:hypothetical protein